MKSVPAKPMLLHFKALLGSEAIYLRVASHCHPTIKLLGFNGSVEPKYKPFSSPIVCRSIGLLQLELPPLPKATADDIDTSTFLPKLNFDVFSLPMKMFGGGTNGKEDVKTEPPQKNQIPRRSF
ncbi:MAG: hypothetical protein U0930_26045 [Pirellulales bacterium]